VTIFQEVCDQQYCCRHFYRTTSVIAAVVVMEISITNFQFPFRLSTTFKEQNSGKNSSYWNTAVSSNKSKVTLSHVMVLLTSVLKNKIQQAVFKDNIHKHNIGVWFTDRKWNYSNGCGICVHFSFFTIAPTNCLSGRQRLREKLKKPLQQPALLIM